MQRHTTRYFGYFFKKRWVFSYIRTWTTVALKNANKYRWIFTHVFGPTPIYIIIHISDSSHLENKKQSFPNSMEKYLGVISWFLFHPIWKNYVLYWDFDLKSWIVDFFTRFTREKTAQNNFSSQNFSVENN